MDPKIWEASGHIGAFNDPLVDCKQCKARYRADELVILKMKKLVGMKFNVQNVTKGNLTEPRQFNLMFKTYVGAVEEDSSATFRPETAQGIYVNYLLVQNAMRLKLPFGIAQIGKAFRNEIVARNFIFELENLNKWKCNILSSQDRMMKL